MCKIHNVSDCCMIIEQETETLLVNIEYCGVSIKSEFMTSDGYEVGMEVKLNAEELEALYTFLKSRQNL